jgi:hypothetical protein
MRMSEITSRGISGRWLMSACLVAGIVAAVVLPGVANADAPALLGDLDPLSPEKLTKEQLEQLLPGAKMSRIAKAGSTHFWTNDPDGTLIISTDNKAGINRSITNRTGIARPGTWHISPDGRYCVTVEWKTIDTEDWCRYMFKTSEGYFAAKSDKTRTEKVYRFWINGN